MNSAMIATFNEVATAVHANASRHPMETVNAEMRAELESAFMAASNKAEFIRAVKVNTGLTSKGIKASKACQYLISKI